MKTIHKAAESANAYDYPYFKGLKHDAFDDGFKSGVKWAEQWISVKEELPIRMLLENGITISCSDFVLTKTECGNVFIGRYEHNQSKWFIPEGTEMVITHWRPIEHK